MGGDSDNATIYIMKASSTLPSTVNIEGGNYTTKNDWILNIKDAVRSYAKFNVTGGVFTGFNPSDCGTEGVHTNWVANGYSAKDNGNGTWSVVEGVACIGNDYYKTLAAAVAAAASGDEIELTNNYKGTDDKPLLAVNGKNLILNMNGHTLEGSGCDGVVYAYNNANVTIKGNGTLIANECKNCDPNEGYGYAVRANNSTITIVNGSYKLNAYNLDTQKDMIYAQNNATINIQGGHFESAIPKFTLNLKDNSGSNIVVTGGSFKGFNPAAAETEPTKPYSFVANGYKATENNGVWTVTAE